MAEFTHDDKAQEDRLRRKAQRLGMTLQKSRRRNVEAPDYGLYRLIDSERSIVVAGYHPWDYSWDLNDVEVFLQIKEDHPPSETTKRLLREREEQGIFGVSEEQRRGVSRILHQARINHQARIEKLVDEILALELDAIVSARVKEKRVVITLLRTRIGKVPVPQAVDELLDKPIPGFESGRNTLRRWVDFK